MMLGWNPAQNRFVSMINDMPQDEFDQLTRKLLKEMRFNVTKSNSTNKYLEFEATRDGDEQDRVFLIRAARGQKKATPEELQATVGKRAGGREMSPVYISTGGFTDEAQKYAEMLDISLADGEKVGLLLQKFNLTEDMEKKANARILEKDGSRFLPSIDELENNMKWGNDFYASGNFKKAAEYFDAAIRIKPEYDLGWLMRGNCLNSLGRHEEAIESFKKSLEHNPESEEAWYNLGATLYSMGRFEDEIACYDKALELRPDFTKAWNNKGATLHQLGKFEEAVMCYDRVLKLEPDNASVLNNRGVALKNLGRHDEALASLDAAIRKKEDYVDAWLNKGLLLQDAGRYQEAIACYDRVLVKWKSPEVLCQRGVALAMLGRYRSAIESFDASLVLKPGWQVAIEEREKAERALRGEADARKAKEEGAKRLEAERLAEADKARRLLEKEKTQEAERAARELDLGSVCAKCQASIGPDARFCSRCGATQDVDDDIDRPLPVGKPAQLEAIEDDEAAKQALDREAFLLLRSSILRSLERFDDALKDMDEAVGISEMPATWLEMGNVLAGMGRLEDAADAYGSALERDPENYAALANLERVLADSGKHRDALDANGRLTALAPEEPHGWIRRSNILRALGRMEDAVECLDKAVGLAPGMAEAWNSQGAALLEMGKHEDAIMCLDRAIQIDSEFAEAWCNKGAAVLASGDANKSIQYFDRAIDIDPEQASAWANKGSALCQMGRFTEASECLDEAISLERDKRFLNSRGWALLGDKRIAEALESVEDAIAMDQEYAEAWNNRGIAYLKKEELAEAYDSFDRAAAIDPNHEDARKNRDAARRRIEQATGKSPVRHKGAEPRTTAHIDSRLEAAVKSAEKLEAEELEAEEFRCPYCNALGSIDDVFCEKCGQRFSTFMKEDAVEEKLEGILDDGEKPARKPDKKKSGKKARENLIEALVSVPGVGYAKAGSIIDAGYDSEAKLKKATTEELARISGISDGLARKIKKKYK